VILPGSLPFATGSPEIMEIPLASKMRGCIHYLVRTHKD
jgi:hypothetical protein